MVKYRWSCYPVSTFDVDQALPTRTSVFEMLFTHSFAFELIPFTWTSEGTFGVIHPVLDPLHNINSDFILHATVYGHLVPTLFVLCAYKKLMNVMISIAVRAFWQGKLAILISSRYNYESYYTFGVTLESQFGALDKALLFYSTTGLLKSIFGQHLLLTKKGIVSFSTNPFFL